MLRRTKIIATLGPALDDEAVLEKVILAGANVFRANFSHGEAADHERRINAVKKIAAKHGLPRYPFFLEGVTGNRALVLEDGLHPNRAGVEQMVRSILPMIRTFLDGIRG